MAKKGYTPEQIINKLREAELLLQQGGYHCNSQQINRGQWLHLLSLA